MVAGEWPTDEFSDLAGKVKTYHTTGIIHGRKVLRIIFFAIVREKTFAIQAISYTKIPAEVKTARKHLQMLPDLQNS